jgi:hypothetical protein
MEKARQIRRKLEAFEASTSGPLSGFMLGRSHLLFTWLNGLIREERIVDAVEYFTEKIYSAGPVAFSSRK